ncbi:MAG: DUF4143 domain-containing protein [Actinomycetia bacterium]|nr:DUF4143 domain-containing protein [Actinomycetes bacterium]
MGKSTLAAMLTDGPGARLFTLDDEATLAAAKADSRAFVDQVAKGTMVIDEVQRHPALMLAIKASIDRDRRPGRFVLTGSSDLLRLPSTPDSLAGRAATLRLRGLSQGELADAEPEDFVAAALSGGRPELHTSSLSRAEYAARIARGAFPELQTLTGRLHTTWLDSYLERVIRRDSVDLPGGGQPERSRAVIRLIAANQAGELVKARLAQQAGVPAQSITTYLDALATVFLTETLPPWTPNLTRREIGRHKAMVADSALAMRLSRVSREQISALIGGEMLGGLLEGFVITEMLKQRDWSEHGYQLFHFRDRNGWEVDLVIELDDGRVIGIEVKASSTFRAEHFAGLVALRDRLGDRFAAGFVLGTAEAAFQYAERLWGMPVAALWEWRPKAN